MLPGPAPQPPGIDDELPLPPPLPTTSAFAALLERKELLDHGAVGNVFRARMSGLELVLKEAKGEASATSVAREAQALSICSGHLMLRAPQHSATPCCLGQQGCVRLSA